jgi:hypothetical protein
MIVSGNLILVVETLAVAAAHQPEPGSGNVVVPATGMAQAICCTSQAKLTGARTAA